MIKKYLFVCLLLLCWAMLQACAGQVVVERSNVGVGDQMIRERGTVKRFQVRSALVDDREIYVWLPAGYSPENRYTVLYMHDGQSLYDSTTTWNKQEWMVDETMDRLLAEGKIQPTIVVGIANNGNKRHAEFFPQKALAAIPQPQQSELLDLMPGGPQADNYLRFLVTELKPFIDSTFSTHTDAAHTLLAGSSMGGLISLYALSEYPEVFGGAACLSTHWIGTFQPNRQIPAALSAYLAAKLPAAGQHKLYFDHGTEGLDTHYEIAQQQVDALLRERGYTSGNWQTQVYQGADHTERDWAKRLDKPLLFLLGR